MKIAMYARVSSETQAKEGTIESQIEALKTYAKGIYSPLLKNREVW
jgi:DNA invertase Pin-like site-specific DNA recombinase